MSRSSIVSFNTVFRVIGWLLIVEGLIMCFPLFVGFYYDEATVDGWLYSIFATMLSGGLMSLCIPPSHREMNKREAILLTVMVWIFVSGFGMLPYIFCKSGASVIDSFFESTSGFTTTGATIFVNVEILPKSILLWRALSQWVGGMGIILFTLAVLPMLNHQGGIQMFKAEVSGLASDKMRPRISSTAKSLWILYGIITIVEIGLLFLGPMDLFDSVCTTFATVSTGGFSTRNGSLADWNSMYIYIIVMVFMFICSINFQLLIKAAYGKVKPLLRNDTFRGFLLLIFIIYVLMTLSLIIRFQFDNWSDYIIRPLFMVVSCISSTCFEIAKFEEWGQFVFLLTLFMMFFGACAGSTTSGAKIDRLILLLKSTKNEFYKILHPNSVLAVRVNGKTVPYDSVSKVVAFLAIYVMVWGLCSAILTFLGVDFLDALYVSISCICNAGLGYGYTGLNGSFAELSDSTKFFLPFVMIMGRLELFSFLLIFTKYFWTK